MRLVEVELENYKQYAGTHVFRPGEKAMVAIVGHNGAGKTTLFEAIEWCLYNPSHIRNDSLIPRVQGGKPRVRVVLEDLNAGIAYEIERSLKGGSTKAEIYRTDRPESPLVQGTRQVTDFVTRELTGLPHAAFVSTFFTKQKELSFFGDMGPTERREQVGRLLGLETIRVAQKSIGERRARKLAEANVKRAQYEEQSQGIDFPAERARLDSVICEQTRLRDQARSEEEACRKQTAIVSAAQETAQGRFATHAGLHQQRERVTGDRRRFTDSRATNERELIAIGEAAMQIERLRAEAEREPVLRGLIETHDAKKQKQDESTRLTIELDRLLRDRRQFEEALDENERRGIEGESDSSERADSTVAAFDDAIAQLAAIDLDALRGVWANTAQLAKIALDKATSETKLAKMKTLAEELTREASALAIDGTPAERLAKAQGERTDLRQQVVAATTSAKQTAERMQQLQTLERSLRVSEFGEVCPTCARPFQPGEATRTLDALTEQIRLLNKEIESKRTQAARTQTRIDELATIEERSRVDEKTYQELAGRLQRSAGVIESQEREVATFSLELGRLLHEAKRHDIPEQAEIDQLEQNLKTAEERAKRRSGLEARREQLLAAIAQHKQLSEQLAKLGVIDYDIDAHRRDYAAWEVARDAAARIEELTKRVAERPAREAAIAQADASLAESVIELERIDRDLATLGYSENELTEANRAATEALERERRATSAAHAAEASLRDANRARADLDAFETRLRSLNEEATAAQLAHTELSRIYSEFARFEKFVALVVTPHMSDIASGLLSSVTDGKYDRLEFTEDYGIEVYDGEDDRFPLSQYSGGERDVIALCARLALSQVIGGQATTPIEFMVLDEVFGSLDLDRRRNLMEMLQRLMEENQAFRQLFVISHVDDVKAGAMFDEVWRVSESPGGVSQLEQVSVTGALEDY